jgi:hypothetical protein
MLEMCLLQAAATETRMVKTLFWVKQTCLGHVTARSNRTLYRLTIPPILQHSLAQVAVNISPAADSRANSRG